MSIRPGSSVTPGRSTRVAPAGTASPCLPDRGDPAVDDHHQGLVELLAGGHVEQPVGGDRPRSWHAAVGAANSAAVAPSTAANRMVGRMSLLRAKAAAKLARPGPPYRGPDPLRGATAAPSRAPDRPRRTATAGARARRASLAWPDTAISAASRPSAGACMTPWPELPLTRRRFGQPGAQPSIAWWSGDISYSPAHARCAIERDAAQRRHAGLARGPRCRRATPDRPDRSTDLADRPAWAAAAARGRRGRAGGSRRRPRSSSETSTAGRRSAR